MKEIKVNQLENKNQFLIETKSALYFQSYESVVAKYDKKTHTLFVNEKWDYSNTTRKHFYIFIYEYCCVSVIEDALYNSKSKRAAIKKLLKEKVIKKSKYLD